MSAATDQGTLWPPLRQGRTKGGPAGDPSSPPSTRRAVPQKREAGQLPAAPPAARPPHEQDDSAPGRCPPGTGATVPSGSQGDKAGSGLSQLVATAVLALRGMDLPPGADAILAGSPDPPPMITLAVRCARCKRLARYRHESGAEVVALAEADGWRWSARNPRKAYCRECAPRALAHEDAEG